MSNKQTENTLYLPPCSSSADSTPHKRNTVGPFKCEDPERLMEESVAGLSMCSSYLIRHVHPSYSPQF